MTKFKKAQQLNYKAQFNVFELGCWLQRYAEQYHVVDPNGVYEFEFTIVAPEGEPAYIQELKFKRVDRKVR